MQPIQIATRRLQLRPLGSEYLQTVNEYALDPENTKYMCHLPNQHSEETVAFLRHVDAQWAMDTPEVYEFAILYQNRHIGAVSLAFAQGVGELGWILNRKYWGNGFAYEAASAVMQYFIQHMGVTHFIAHCDAENIASYKLMQKLGMVKTGEWGGRRNRVASQDSIEYQYEWIAPPQQTSSV